MSGFGRVIEALREVEGQINTVFSLGVIARVDETETRRYSRRWTRQVSRGRSEAR